MPCNCGCNKVKNFGFNSLCNDCEPNAANINLCDCAGYGANKNQCDCACPPSTEPICGCGCGRDCGCGCGKKPYYPAHECPGTPFNPLEELAKRASRCVVDRIANAVDEEIEMARTQFTNECVRQALGTANKRMQEFENDGRKACHQCGCQRQYDCCCCPPPCPCPCPCPVCDYEELIRQTVQAVANEMTEDLFKAVNKIAEEYECLINNLQTPFSLTTINVTAAPQGECCVINPNTGCGACPTAGKSSNATTWGRCV